MSSKKWFITFLSTILLLLVLWGGLNIAVDPFGVFGDKLLNWYSYNETLNPRVAKLAYLEKNHTNYDSYIIGASSTSSYPIDELNSYLDAKFYNLIMYGADMKDVEDTVRYLIEHYHMKNLIVNVYIDNGITYNYGEDTITNNLHVKVTGGAKAKFYSQYIFLNPQYAIAKLTDYQNDTYLPQTFDVFDEATGAYDKRKRDIENISDMPSYLQSYPVFASYPKKELSLPNTDRTMESLVKVRDMCSDAGINFYVVSAPVYSEYLDNFSMEQVTNFFTKLAQVTPFWDFTMSSVSHEPRYFYDATHFRNNVGTMALARMFNASDLYIPEDFGVYVTPENVSDHLQTYSNAKPLEENDISARIPILMYHHIAKEGDGGNTISQAAFETQIQTLSTNGYTSVTFVDLINYVDYGIPLPEKPVVITFDDGYLSNYEIAYPILQKYNMKATIFPIGSTVGLDRYKDTDHPIIPHFTYEQAAEMIQSGLISIQSHTYDMHQWEPFESTQPVRPNMLILENEDEDAYIKVLKDDITKSKTQIESNTNQTVNTLAYPSGLYNDLSQVVLTELGIRVTLTTTSGTNTIIKGLPQSLLAMKRYSINDSTTPEDLLQLLD